MGQPGIAQGFDGFLDLANLADLDRGNSATPIAPYVMVVVCIARFLTAELVSGHAILQESRFHQACVPEALKRPINRGPVGLQFAVLLSHPLNQVVHAEQAAVILQHLQGKKA